MVNTNYSWRHRIDDGGVASIVPLAYFSSMGLTFPLPPTSTHMKRNFVTLALLNVTFASLCSYRVRVLHVLVRQIYRSNDATQVWQWQWHIKQTRLTDAWETGGGGKSKYWNMILVGRFCYRSLARWQQAGHPRLRVLGRVENSLTISSFITLSGSDIAWTKIIKLWVHHRYYLAMETTMQDSDVCLKELWNVSS